jgi:hypothetical protein
MGKFKAGDKVILKEGAVYPQNGKPWSESDPKMIPGAVFEVSCTGKYSWKNIQYDCVGLEDNHQGWIPEDCFDFAEQSAPIPLLLLPEKWYVKCTDNSNDTPELKEWRDCEWYSSGIIDQDRVWYDLKCAGGTEISYDDFLKLVYNPWKAQQPITTLPEKWYVLCDRNPYSTPELLEWRKGATNHGDWDTSGTISETGYWTYKEDAKGIKLPYSTFIKLVYKPWKATQKEPSISADPRIVTSADVGAKVVRGRDWDWGDQDGNGVGTILSKSSEGWVIVKWNNGLQNSYRIGGDACKYDLYYYTEPITMLTPYSKELPSDSIKQYSYPVTESTTPDETPRLTIKKPKTKLLSTEVKELNVNLKLLKNN